MYSLSSTISLIEVIWTIIVFVGMIVSALNLSNVIEDRHYLMESDDFIEDGPRHTIVKSRIRLEGIKTGTMLGFLMIGVAAMNTRPAENNVHNPFAIMLALIFISVAAATVIDSFLYQRDRETIRQWYKENLPRTMREAIDRGEMPSGH